MPKNKPRSLQEIDRTIRKFWNINPVTRTTKDKTKYTRKKKHKNKENDYE